MRKRFPNQHLKSPPHLEPLERRLLLSASVINTSDIVNYAYDSLRNRVYITHNSSIVDRYDLTTQQFLTPWTISGDPRSIDISPDDSTLYLGDHTSGTLYSIDLTSNAITNFPSPIAGWFVSDLKAMANGTVLVEEIFSAEHVFSFDTTTHVFTDISSQDISDTFARNGARTFAADLSQYHFTIFSPTAQISTFDPPEFYGTLYASISYNGGMLSVMDNAGGGHLYDASGQSLIAIPTGTSVAAFDPQQPRFYIINGTTLYTYDTSNFQLLGSTSVGAVDREVPTFSDDGTQMLVTSGSQIHVLTVPADWFPSSLNLALNNSPDSTTSLDLSASFSGLPQGFLPSGVVNFFDAPSVNGVQTLIGSATISDGTVSHLILSPLSAGIHYLSASYAGDQNFIPENSSASALTITPSTSAITLSVPPTDALFGQSILFTAHLALENNANSFGKVVYLRDTESNTNLSSANIDLNGNAVFSILPTELTTHLAAYFPGDSDFASSQSDPATLTLGLAPVNLVLSHPSDWIIDASIQFGAGFPLDFASDFSGQVDLYDGEHLISQMTASQTLEFSILSLTGGAHDLHLVYLGNDFFATGMQSLDVTLPQVTATTLTLSAAKSPIPGDPISITAKITAAKKGPAINGTLTISGNGAVLGTATVKSGKTSYSFTFPRFGDEDITAAFQPTSATYRPSSSELPLHVQTQFIDILALYSNQEAPLGQPTLLSHIDAHIAATNQAFANSGIPIVLRLVGLLGAGYSESGNLKTDLNELAFSSDVATARNRFGADLVVLMDSAGTQSDDTIGIATVLTSQTSSLKNRAAFIVIDDSQPADSDVLAHEVGHTLGAAHAVGDPQGGGATRYARGYRFIGQDGQQYHDIMAYAPGIPIPYFSNPGITYQGVPEGNAATGDASRAISEDASIVAGYRAAKPIGAIDNATLTTLTGDAFDPRTSDPLTLRVDIDNKTHDTFLADESRDNLTAQFGVTVHGFTYTIPRLTQGNHTIKIYALDPFTGAAVLIATKTISSPSPLFDESYYLANNPDVVTLIAQGKYKSGWDEFQKVGQFQGRDPSLYFNTQYYLANNPDLAALSAKGKLSSPFANYVSSGQFHHRPASALFDEAFYLSTNPSVTPALLRQYKSPIMQFLLQGSYQGLLAVPPA